MKQFLKKHYLIVILIVLNLVFAVVFGSDFGDSYDEQARYEVALDGLEHLSRLKASQNIGDKGPIYFVTAKLGSDIIQLVKPDLSNIQAWHYIHFLFFLFAIVGLYSIALKFLSPSVAFTAAALFNTQPVLFGHAFINPKDIPFLSLFLLTIALGIRIPEKLPKTQHPDADKFQIAEFINTLINEWKKSKSFFRVLTIIALLPLGMVPILITFKIPIQGKIQTFINSLNNSHLADLTEKAARLIFQGTIENGISLANVRTAYPYLEFSALVTSLVIFLATFGLLYTKSFKYLIGFSTLEDFWESLRETSKDPWIYLGGIVLGYSISNRSLGIAAGLYVLYYFWAKKRSEFLAGGLLYFSISLITLYLTWPALWANPILGLLKSLLKVSSFGWGGKTLFWGRALSPDQLSALYFPTLIGIQLTIPALVLFLIGIVVFLIKREEYQLDMPLFMVISIWFLLPFGSIVIIKPTIYDNFRHFLFITPPIFLLSGLTMKYLLEKLKKKLLQVTLIGVILFPGLLGIIKLHPYQYIYYNQLIGGVEGAFRRFETDYWYTSYVDCIRYLNGIAQHSSTILVYGPAHIVESYAREDLHILTYKQDEASSQLSSADYFIISSRGNKDLELASSWEDVYQVSRGGALLAVVKEHPH